MQIECECVKHNYYVDINYRMKIECEEVELEKGIITHYYVQSLHLHALIYVYQFIDQIEEIIIEVIK